MAFTNSDIITRAKDYQAKFWKMIMLKTIIQEKFEHRAETRTAEK
jgi:hypothetical protein